MTARTDIEVYYTILNASADAARRGHRALTPEQMLLKLCDNSQAKQMLAEAGIDIAALKAALNAFLDSASQLVDANIRPTSYIANTPETKAIFDGISRHIPKDRSVNLNGAFYVAAMTDGDTPVAALLRKHGLDAQTAQKALETVTATYKPSPLETMALQAR